MRNAPLLTYTPAMTRFSNCGGLSQIIECTYFFYLTQSADLKHRQTVRTHEIPLAVKAIFCLLQSQSLIITSNRMT